MKIAVYTIALNEAKHIQRWAESAKDADYRVVLDTGSTDDTVKIAKDLNLIVETKTLEPFRFNDARNASLALVPEDVDFCISLDADEVLHEGWRKRLEKNIKENPGYKQFSLYFVNSRLPDGSIGQGWARPVIHSRNNSYWKWPIHEIMCVEDTGVAMSDVVAEHFPDKTKPRNYMPLLEQAVKDMPDDTRMSFYYGRELSYAQRLEECAVELKRYLDLGGWSYERSEAMVMLSRCEPDNAEHWLMKACAETLDRREPFVALSQYYYNNKIWTGALAMAERALLINDRNPSYITEDSAWGFLPADMAAQASYLLGNMDMAKYFGQMALTASPNDERLKTNMDWYNGLITGE